jgi:glycosyltransferase involved in cell wall biosynthesis
MSENLYSEVLRSTRPDKFLLLSPFEGLGDEACWQIPKGICAEAIYYDAIPRIFPEKYLLSPVTKKWYLYLESKVAQVHRLHAISQSSRNDALKFLSISEDIVKKIDFGLNCEEKVTTGDHTFDDSKIILAVLGEDERKNKINLLHAWKILREKNIELKLKIVYKQSPPESLNNENFLIQNDLKNTVEFLDYVSQEELEKLYNSCAFTVFPSFYEGLGLPVLESFKANKACIVANSSSLSELVYSSALKVDPNSPEDISEAVINLLDNQALQKQAVEDGREVLSRYSSSSKYFQMQNILDADCTCRNVKEEEYLQESVNGIYFHTILKPTKSGIANFADNLIHPFHTRRNMKIVSFGSNEKTHVCPECSSEIEILSPQEYRKIRDSNFLNIHNLGNSSYHLWQTELIGQYPGMVLMHDGFLSGLVWVRSLGNLNTGKFLRNAMMDSSSLNFLDSQFLLEPQLLIQKERLNSFFIESATSIIVHNQAAGDQIANEYVVSESRSIGVMPLPTSVVGQSYTDTPRKKVIGVLGIIHETKMYQEIIEAWIESETGRKNEYVLRFIGEDLSQNFQHLQQKYGKRFRIEFTGFIDEEAYRNQIEQIEFAIQLRREFRGESSGAIVDLLSSGVPVISNAQPSLKDYPDDSIAFINPDFSTADLALKIDNIQKNLNVAVEKASVARNYLIETANPIKCADQMLKLAEESQFHCDFFPISQIAIQLKMSEIDEGEDSLIMNLAKACLESFPPPFIRRRILVIVGDKVSIDPKLFTAALFRLKSKLKELNHPQIHFCKEVSGLIELETVNSCFFDKEIQNAIGDVDFKIRITRGDLILRGLESNSSQEYSSVVKIIQSELAEFLKYV